MPDTCNRMTIIDLGKCNPPIGVELDGASGDVRYFGDSCWPAVIYEALVDSTTAGTGTCRIFVRVCPSGEAAHALGMYEMELLRSITHDDPDYPHGEFSIFEPRVFDLRGLSDADIDNTLDEVYAYAQTGPVVATLHDADASAPSKTWCTASTLDVHRRLVQNNLEKIDHLMTHVETSVATRHELPPLAGVRVPRCEEHLRLPVEARNESLACWAILAVTHVQTTIAALNIEPVEPARSSRWTRTYTAGVGVQPADRRPMNAQSWLGDTSPSPVGTPMVGSEFTAEELLNIENTIGERVCVGPSPPSEPSSIVPRETPPEIDDALAHQPPTTMLATTDGLMVGLPEPPISGTPPRWVCCAHGHQHIDLTRMYDWLKAKPRCCDNASVMSFFVLLQYNPQAYEECKTILRDMADTVGVRNHSAKLASMVEDARKVVNPAGNVYAGQNARIQDDDHF